MCALCPSAFSHVYDLAMAPLEFWLKDIRQELLAPLSGKGIEVAAGSGLNFEHYPAATHIVATEPDPVLLKKAELRATSSAANIELSQNLVQDLAGIKDDTFDFAVATLAFCTIDDIPGALKELKRVLKPDARLHLLEHVNSTSPLVQSAFELMHGPWQKLAGGCRLGQNTIEIMQRNFFQISNIRSYNSFLLSFQAVPA